MKNIFFLMLTLWALEVEGQSKRGNVWVTGSGGQKIFFNGNNISTNNLVFYPTYFSGGNSNICDTNGNLVLCSNGFNIYGNNANFIDEGDSLTSIDYYTIQNGWSPIPQSSLFLPVLNNKYYFINSSMSNARVAQCNANIDCNFDWLHYSVVDMNANGGAGKVVQRMMPLMENTELSKTQMMACRHSNGNDWWLLKQGADSNIVYKFLFLQDTVINMGIQKFDAPIWGNWNSRGQSTFNSDGSRYVTTTHGGSTGKIFLADFDRCYGILSNPKEIIMPVGSQHLPWDTTITEHLSVGLVFSPNGEILYVISMSNIYQYDLQNETWFHVAGLDTSQLHFQDYETGYVRPDGKLYIGNFGGTSYQMSVIDSPNVKGAGCNFCPRCLRMDTLVNGYAGTPPCMPNYSLGAQNCWPLDLTPNPSPKGEGSLHVFPNPANFIIHIAIDGSISSQPFARELYNSVGQLLFSAMNYNSTLKGGEKQDLM